MRYYLTLAVFLMFLALSGCNKGIPSGPIVYVELSASDTLTSLATFYYPGNGIPVPTDSTDQLLFDVNSDGQNDIRLILGHDYNWLPAHYGLTFGGLHDRVKVAVGKQKDLFEWDALVLTEGAEINKELNWQEGSADLWMSDGFTSGGTSNATGLDDGTHYAAFQLDYNARKTYGWLKFTKVGLYVFDISYAYNPRSSIKAGEK